MEGPQKGRFLYNAEEYLPANKALYESKLSTGLKVRSERQQAVLVVRASSSSQQWV